MDPIVDLKPFMKSLIKVFDVALFSVKVDPTMAGSVKSSSLSLERETTLSAVAILLGKGGNMVGIDSGTVTVLAVEADAPNQGTLSTYFV